MDNKRIKLIGEGWSIYTKLYPDIYAGAIIKVCSIDCNNRRFEISNKQIPWNYDNGSHAIEILPNEGRK